MKKSLHRLDLNLLLTLQVLLQERSVIKAAKKLNVTQSAVSKSLSILRDWFDDPLFIREPHGLKPTPLALSMEQELSEWFQLGSQLVGKKGGKYLLRSGIPDNDGITTTYVIPDTIAVAYRPAVS